MPAAKQREREKALELRQLGKSYREIREKVKVSKSSLSLWLREHPLSSDQIQRLRDNNPERIKHYRETRLKQREALLKQIYDNEKPLILPLSSRDLFIAGLFLYWGEGAKTKMSWFSLSNTDPSMIRFFISWIEKGLRLNRNNIKIRLHLYTDMDIRREIDFWSKGLNIPKSQFRKPYIKKNLQQNITYRGFRHGTCNIIVNNAIVTKRILMGLKVIQDQFAIKGEGA